MPKVSKIKLHLKNQYGEYYEVHYNAKNAPMFSVKGLPEDFTKVTGINYYGYKTEAELENTIYPAVSQYKILKQSQRKVIIYKSSATAELTMNKINEGSYSGLLHGISTKFGSFGHGSEIASFGISFSVMMEIDHVSDKKYYLIKKDGSLGFSQSLNFKEQVMEWTQEREDFFNNIYSSMREIVLKISQFIDQEPEEVALLIQNNQKLLS
jgi:hypothetical protein